jgi:site-specific DNA-methyltransferase (adenine-specific)
VSGRRGDPLPRRQILVGDARDRLRELPTSSVDTIITSPPYFALRDYGHQDQLGLESDAHGWVKNVVSVCDELARVLKPSGSLWINIADSYSNHQRQGAAKKSLLLGPQRLAIALAEAGWLVRNNAVWSKTNPMPSSVRDRLSTGHETILLCTRSPRYFFDLDAIRIPVVTTAKKRHRASDYQYLPDDVLPAGGDVDDNRGLNKLKAEGMAGHPLGKNPGDVWHISTAGYRGAHFATFPVALVERPLLATCPEKVCAVCGTPWRRKAVDRSRRPPTVGPLVPACECDSNIRPGVVLDPFFGAGTVGIAAEMHGRNWIGIELNPAFAALAAERVATWRRKK